MLNKRLFWVFLALAALVLTAVTGCSSAQASGGKIAPTWINASIIGDSLSIPLGEVQKNTNVHFKMSSPNGQLAFMAYQYGGQTYVRADICPPCQGQSFSLQGDKLICDTCGTVFSAQTGAGVKGACVKYPKASVAYISQGGNMLMKSVDLSDAYLETLKFKP